MVNGWIKRVLDNLDIPVVLVSHVGQCNTFTFHTSSCITFPGK